MLRPYVIPRKAGTALLNFAQPWRTFYDADTEAELPLLGVYIGEQGFAADTGNTYVWSGSSWVAMGGGGGGAPTNATYLVATNHAGLSAEIVAGDLAFLDTVDTGEIEDEAVTLPKIANIADLRVLGNSSGGAGPVTEHSLAGGLSMSGGVLSSATVALDLGDDGSNESAALTEIATVGDRHSAVTEPSADKALFDFSRIGRFSRYSPWRKPSSGIDAASSDEFLGSVDSSKYVTGNFSTSSAVAADDRLLFTVPADAGRNWRCLWYPTPSGDWTITTSVVIGPMFHSFHAWGLLILDTGTVATPTSLLWLGSQHGSFAGFYPYASYTAAAGTVIGAINFTQRDEVFFQFRYVSGTKVLNAYCSPIGAEPWGFMGTRTLSAAPVKIGIGGNGNTSSVIGTASFGFLRTIAGVTGRCGE